MTETDYPFGPTQVPEQYQSIILTASQRWGVPPQLLAAQINQESSFDPTAESPAGAIGIAQFLPSTAKSLGIDPRNPTEAIDGMAKLMSHYYKEFGTWEKALYAYHGGPGAVDDPGPLSKEYADKILGKIGEIASILPVTNPVDATSKLLKNLRDPAFLNRLGLGAMGIGLVLVAVIFMVLRGGSGKAIKVLAGGNKTGSAGKTQ